MEKLQSSQGSMVDDIHEFSKRFRLPQPDKPELLDNYDMEYRVSFIQEELRELQYSHDDEDMEGVLDALVDLVYVALGTAWLMNLPFEEAWNRVHEANLEKERATSHEDPRSKRHHRWDIVKPKGWKPARFKDLL